MEAKVEAEQRLPTRTYAMRWPLALTRRGTVAPVAAFSSSASGTRVVNPSRRSTTHDCERIIKPSADTASPSPPHPGMALMRFNDASLAPPAAIEGGSFEYARSPGVFLGRDGFGPLKIAWDTCLLLDWAQYSEPIINGDLHTEQLEDRYAAELEALGGLMMTVWMTRDMRIYVFARQLGDAKRRLPAVRRSRRADHVHEVVQALQCLMLAGPPPSGDSVARLSASIPGMCESVDRDLVAEAVLSGCHVFLSRDRKHVLRHRGDLRAFGIVAVSPTELIDELAFSGELGAVFGADGLVCDSHKWGHLWSVCCPGE